MNLYTTELIDRIKRYNITLHITLYHKKNEEKIINFFKSYNITYIIYYKIFDNTNEIKFFQKFFTKQPIDGNNNTVWCDSKFNCCQLKDTKLYVCQYMGYLNYLFDYFGQDYAEQIGYASSSPYLDLTQVHDYEEIYNYVLNYNDDICQHCIDKWTSKDFSNRILNRLVNWKTSDKNINEWICENIDKITQNS